MKKIKTSEITPEHLYISRRRFLKGAGALTASALVLAACGRQSSQVTPISETPTTGEPNKGEGDEASLTDELGDPATSYKAITNYNDYYEFSTGKEAVARMAEDFPTSPWKVEVSGLVNHPQTFDIDDLRQFEAEERIYRLRCVEAWSMVIPWLGFPLARLLKEVEPTSKANYVKFQSVYDPENMPGQQTLPYPWPYLEGLRLDEAMHDLTLMATGLYGDPLPPQNGAPVRLVVPWKYGFKSIKAIVKIELVEEMPTSLWMAVGPNEYGFWANVNPEVDHPRWSQATERRIGESGRRETLYFNGYADEVSDLYTDLDARKWYY
ncbi:MAG: protein-methionine-sulfoxide reductase catalytic subunit MsrP [Chloroflexi bacterium]|jgi:sulfoxide reductase catalytic subunit YedY|nr:protein-methionine-sulfoxide reductase catalytic subunit MsrP [Chloroflexota bacterium]